MIVLRAEGIHKSYATHVVLSGVSLAVGERDRIGLIGANGTGKSTLLRILAGEVPDAGDVSRALGVRVALLAQELDLREGTLWEVVVTGVGEILARRAEWEQLSTQVSETPHRADLLRRLGEVQAALEDTGGFAYEARVRQTLHGVGLPENLWRRPVGNLSGGERTRLNLARTLLAAPDVLLLDEPTNHLDVAAIEWLEEFLSAFRGAVVIVSHDRRLLERRAGRIAELEDGHLSLFRGNYATYRQVREKELLAAEAAYARHHQELARLREFVRKQLERAARIQGGPKAGRDYYGRIAKKVARQAQTARKRLARLEASGPSKPRTPDRVHLTVEAGEGTGPALAHLRGVTVSFDARVLFGSVSLTLGRDERVGLVGSNGSGKTTLLRLLAREHAPSTGEVWVGPGVRAGYLPQIPFTDGGERRVLDVALDAGLDPTDARAVLGALLFRGDRVYQPVRNLSGGERTRLALLEFIAGRCSLLLLDEPTNHLDLPSRERLEEVLEAYAGTLVIASHDRYLLDRLCNRIWAIEDGTVVTYGGNYADYLRRRAQRSPYGSPPDVSSR